MGMVYTWKSACHATMDAQVAGEELERIRVRQNGRLDAKDVVEASRSEDAPLHGAFEWNDATAADAYRVDQARYLIRSIDVVIQQAEETKAVRAFVSVKRDEDRSYTSLAHAMSDSQLRAQVVADALAELAAWRKRHAELVELAQIFSVIDQAQPGR